MGVPGIQDIVGIVAVIVNGFFQKWIGFHKPDIIET